MTPHIGRRCSVVMRDGPAAAQRRQDLKMRQNRCSSRWNGRTGTCLTTTCKLFSPAMNSFPRTFVVLTVPHSVRHLLCIFASATFANFLSRNTGIVPHSRIVDSNPSVPPQPFLKKCVDGRQPVPPQPHSSSVVPW